MYKLIGWSPLIELPCTEYPALLLGMVLLGVLCKCWFGRTRMEAKK